MTDTSGFSADNPTEIVIAGKKKSPPSPPPPPPMSKGRRPRGVVKIDGNNASFLSFSVDSSTHFNADKWRVELECWNQPEDFGIFFWDDAANVQVECLMGFLGQNDDVSALPSSPTSMILGQVDNVSVDPIRGCISLSGRDLTARLIDTKTTMKWPDAVASHIVTQLANQVGLTPQVTATNTPVGQYQDSAYSQNSRDVPMWDIITYLAQQEGFDAYVTGTTLYFGPPQADTDSNPIPVTVEVPTDTLGISSNGTRVRLGRSLTLASDISVTILSHGVKNGTIKATATRAGTKAAGSSAGKASATVQNYTIRRPNLTQDQAQTLANNTLADLTKHEKTMTVCMEGDPAVSVHRMLTLSGTGTAWDQKYYIQSIERNYEFGGPFDMEISAKNHPTQSDTSL